MTANGHVPTVQQDAHDRKFRIYCPMCRGWSPHGCYLDYVQARQAADSHQISGLWPARSIPRQRNEAVK